MSCFNCFKKKKLPSNDIHIHKTNNLHDKVKIYLLLKFDFSQIGNRRRSKISKNQIRNFVNPSVSSKVKISKKLYELKDQFRCIFCGGAGCKHEDYTKNKNSVMEGMNCDQINDDLFASQRPSTILIEKFQLIKRFKE
jgi:hypothetical protein